MFAITTSNASTTATADSTPSDMSLEDLVYIQPSDLPPPQLRALKFDDDDDVDDKCILPPPAFSPTSPACVEIKTERFQAVHTTREIQAKEEASLKSRDPRLPATAIAQLQEEAESSNLADLQAQTVFNAAKDHVKDNGQLPSHVREGLNILYRQLRTKWERPQTPIDEWDYNTSSEWADDEEYKELWPTPPKTPPQGDENHPPSSSVCGEHPGLGWELNTPGTVMYYRFLIPDPTTNRCVVAPFLTYFIQHERPEVSATYGKGYPIHTRLLQPLPVDYFVPSMTPEQIGLLDAQSPCANAINKVLNTYFPYHISAAVRQYQYFKETQYAIQRTIKHLQNKEQRYLEKAVGLLSELENANFLGRLMAHGDVIIEDLEGKDPRSCAEYLSRTRYFEGDITQSALDPKVNPFRSSRTPTDNDDPRLNPTTEREQRIADVWWQAHPECERERLRPRSSKFADRRCHKCREKGHIRRNCPKHHPAHYTRNHRK